MRMSKIVWLAIFATIVVFAFLVAQTTQNRPAVTDNGGGTVTGSGKSNLASIGQSVPGIATGSGQTNYAGFIFALTLPSGEVWYDTIRVDSTRGDTVEFPTPIRGPWLNTNGTGVVADFGLTIISPGSWNPDAPWNTNWDATNTYWLWASFSTANTRPTIGTFLDDAHRLTTTTHWGATGQLGESSNIANGEGRYLWMNMVVPRYYSPDSINVIHVRMTTRAHVP